MKLEALIKYVQDLRKQVNSLACFGLELPNGETEDYIRGGLRQSISILSATIDKIDKEISDIDFPKAK